MSSSRFSIPCNPAAKISPAANNGVTSSPFDFANPTAFALALRSARRRSASTWTLLRCFSRAANASTSSTKPRRAKAAATPGKSLRNSFGSSTIVSFANVHGSEVFIVRKCSKRDFVLDLCVARAARRQRLPNFYLQSPRDRHIVTAIRHLIRKITLARRIAARFVVRIAVALAITDFLHEACGRVAELQRHLERA